MANFIESNEDITFLVGSVKLDKRVSNTKVEVHVAEGQQVTFSSCIEPFLQWIATPRTDTEIQNWELENLNAGNNDEYIKLNRSGVLRHVPGDASARTKLAAFQGLRLVPLGVTVEHPSDDRYVVYYARHKGAERKWATSNVLAEAMFYDSEDPNRFADLPTKVTDAAQHHGLDIEAASISALGGLADLLSARIVRLEFSKESVQDKVLDKFRRNLGFARLWAQAEPLYPLVRP